jgi:hypothetical protein
MNGIKVNNKSHLTSVWLFDMVYRSTIGDLHLIVSYIKGKHYIHLNNMDTIVFEASLNHKFNTVVLKHATDSFKKSKPQFSMEF